MTSKDGRQDDDHVLEIPDDCGFMDAELIGLLESAVPVLLR